MEININVIEIPNLITASEAREKAREWTNMEMEKCITSLMALINEKASQGKRRGSFKVKTNRPEEFYVTLEKIFKDLGYKIAPAPTPNFGSDYKWWDFEW